MCVHVYAYMSVCMYTNTQSQVSITILQSVCYDFHFTDEKYEIHRSDVSHPRSHRQKVVNQVGN